MTTIRRDGEEIGASVVWTRGEGCRDLADLLATGRDAVRATGRLEDAVMAERASCAVMRRLSAGFDLTNVAVPYGFTPEGTGAVVAAVGGGPHSVLAAKVAEALSSALGVPGVLASAFADDDTRGPALRALEDAYAHTTGLEYRIVEAGAAADLVAAFDENTLFVFGAPGGNWFQRSLFGRGARLRQKAPHGAVIVRSAPLRAFRIMTDPVFVGRLRPAVDVVRVHPQPVLPVVDRGHLVGIVRREKLLAAESGAAVDRVMEDPVSVAIDATVPDIEEVADLFEGAPVPVVDPNGVLVGTVDPSTL